MDNLSQLTMGIPFFNLRFPNYSEVVVTPWGLPTIAWNAYFKDKLLT